MDGHAHAPDATAVAAPVATGTESANPSASVGGLERSVLWLQQAAGNAAVARLIIQRQDETQPVLDFGGPAHVAHRPFRDWETTSIGGREADPEHSVGPLPFNRRGWDGEEIARNLSQLNIAVPTDDLESCVEVSFVAELVQRGPGPVRDAMLHYRSQYQSRISSRDTSPSVRRRLLRASGVLDAAIHSLDERTMTYADLAQLPRAMFTIHARTDPRTGTQPPEEASIAQNEGYTSTAIGEEHVTRPRAAALASMLRPGEYLSCGIDARTEAGTDRAQHNVHIGRSPAGHLFFFDPWPRSGDQLIDLDPDLHRIEEYFVGRSAGRTVTRTFNVDTRFTPPTEVPESSAPGP